MGRGKAGSSPFASLRGRNDKLYSGAHGRNDKLGMDKPYSGTRDSRMKKKNNSKWITDCKERGEWAELWLMALAKGLGLGVLKPFGESGRYDDTVENGGPI